MRLLTLVLEPELTIPTILICRSPFCAGYSPEHTARLPVVFRLRGDPQHKLELEVTGKPRVQGAVSLAPSSGQWREVAWARHLRWRASPLPRNGGSSDNHAQGHRAGVIADQKAQQKRCLPDSYRS